MFYCDVLLLVLKFLDILINNIGVLIIFYIVKFFYRCLLIIKIVYENKI